ncbi:hypothetical protein WICPIJ_002231 [Wickerhamomyces pijperi]|uniref:Anaphase-promoting complex subunit 4 WD40 domain-containing protein n=1 Tax=Wickerhamomyces pijperi TaxID=599730 RepID=A0A9P8Q9D5_WICPI|nr:hypothetical protein WICPIJ_002231 [Wickerhamomyces pijperi]
MPMDWSKAKRSSISAGSYKNPASASGGATYNHLNSQTSSGYPGQAPFYGVNPTSNISQPSLPARSGYYESHWPLFNADWVQSSSTGNDLVALSTYREDSINKIEIIEGLKSVVDHPNGLTSEGLDFHKRADVNTPLPVTKLLWDPDGTERLIATSDRLCLYEFDPFTSQLVERMTLVNGNSSANFKGQQSYPPLTSFDWNKVSNNIVLTSSIDTTCTIWDLNHPQSPKTQLIAHDSEVFDVQFIKSSKDIFASVGADGSMRVFDLRCLDHSTIIYEPQSTQNTPPPPTPTLNPHSLSSSSSAASAASTMNTSAAEQTVPLLRLAASQVDPYTLATFAYRSPLISILDMRYPGAPTQQLKAHSGSINAIRWAPDRDLLVSVGDDCQACIWDLSKSSPTSTASNNNNSSSSGSGTGAAGAASSSMSGASDTGNMGNNGNVKNGKDGLVQGRIEESPAFYYGDGMTEFNGVTWGRGGEWVGVVGGVGFQGVRLAN